MSFTNYDKCSLLLPMNGANNGTTFTDWSPSQKTVTAAGNAKTSTAQFKYYDSSGLFDGTGDYLSIPNHADFAFGSGDFGIGCWVWPGNLTAIQEIIAHRHVTTDSDKFWLFRINATTGTIRFFSTITAGTVTDITSVGTVSANNWTWVEVNRISGSVKIYVGGTNNDIVTTNLTTAYTAPNVPLLIGVGSNTASVPFNGYMQDLIIRKDAPLHSADFTPPPRLIGTISGNVVDEAGSPAQRTIIAVPRSYPTRIFTTQSSASTGNYSIQCPAVDTHLSAFHEGTPQKDDLLARVTVT